MGCDHSRMGNFHVEIDAKPKASRTISFCQTMFAPKWNEQATVQLTWSASTLTEIHVQLYRIVTFPQLVKVGQFRSCYV